VVSYQQSCSAFFFCQNVREKLVNTEELKVEGSKLLILNLVNYLGNIEFVFQRKMGHTNTI
jgi:hypothetical protein